MSLRTVRDKLARRAEGESGRFGENQTAILPAVTSHIGIGLRPQRENRENNSLSSHARGRARAHTRARRGNRGAATSLFSPILPPPGPVTLLKHCRCMDCRRFHQDARGEFFCESYIGGTRVEWATGKRYCDPPPDAWHYCADYHGPQISKDVWAWPRRSHAEVAGVAGPSGGPREDNHGGNGSEAGFFRSTARTEGKKT